jgi:hypothetical protein
VAVGAAAGVAGYLLGSGDDEETAATTTVTERALPAGWRLCTNERLGYAVGYPGDWYSPALSAESECTFFDPAPVALPEASDVFGPTLEVAPAQDTYDVLARAGDEGAGVEILERRELAIAGRRALNIVRDQEASYVVDRGAEPPLVLRTVKEPNSNWEERLRILDEAARTLLLFEPRRARGRDAPPDVVLRKRAAILAAAQARDYDALAQLSDPQRFAYSFGGEVEGGPAAYWRQAETRGEDPTPAEALAAILRMPYTLSRGLYVWPFAYDKTEDELTAYERGLLEELGRGGAFADGYLGWRAGIDPDGRWVFFVAGD